MATNNLTAVVKGEQLRLFALENGKVVKWDYKLNAFKPYTDKSE